MCVRFRSLSIGAILVALVSLPVSAEIEVTAIERDNDVHFFTPGGSLDLSSSTSSTATSGGAFIYPTSKNFVIGKPAANRTIRVDIDGMFGTMK